MTSLLVLSQSYNIYKLSLIQILFIKAFKFLAFFFPSQNYVKIPIGH